jgi:hypothetical protein
MPFPAILSSTTMGRRRPNTMGRQMHVTVTTAPDPELGTPLVTVSAPGGLSAKAPTHGEAMQELNRKIQAAIHTPGTGKGNL